LIGARVADYSEATIGADPWWGANRSRPERPVLFDAARLRRWNEDVAAVSEQDAEATAVKMDGAE
jgi:hypothetical protein